MISNAYDAWIDQLNSLREQFVAAQGWTEKEAKLRLRDGWAVVRDGRVHNLTGGGQRPEDAIPIFEILTAGGWKRPLRIDECLTGLVTKAMTSERSPRDIVMGILGQSLRADGSGESEETTRHRHTAASGWSGCWLSASTRCFRESPGVMFSGAPYLPPSLWGGGSPFSNSIKIHRFSTI